MMQLPGLHLQSSAALPVLLQMQVASSLLLGHSSMQTPQMRAKKLKLRVQQQMRRWQGHPSQLVRSRRLLPQLGLLPQHQLGCA
jgi:hypothetical protein